MSLTGSLRTRLGVLYNLLRSGVIAPAGVPGPAPSLTTELPEQRFALCLDRCVSPDATSLFLGGWLWDPGRRLVRLEIVLGAHTRAVPPAGLMRFPRKDVAAHCSSRFSDDNFDNHGFLAFLSNVEGAARSGFLRAVLRDGSRPEMRLRPLTDPFLCHRQIVESIPPEPFFDSALMAGHIRPAIDRIGRRLPPAGAGRTFSFGSLPSRPGLAIIVPLYKRLELMEHQLAQFANDSAISACELVFVLDDPSIAAEFEFYAFHLAQLYRVPFKAVIMDRHSGYSAANNVGAAASSAPVVLFLNSDVFPTAPAWTERLLEFHQAHADLGALGCKLLYEDRSIQHAGMYFYRDYYPYRLWENLHYFKGLPREWPQAAVDRAVPAVTGAALLVSRSAFEQAGGWDDSYILANYEDSDLCLRLAKNGYTNRYCSSVELYHLERQSQQGAESDFLRVQASFYNRWLQTYRWDGFIGELMKKHAPAGASRQVQAGSVI